MAPVRNARVLYNNHPTGGCMQIIDPLLTLTAPPHGYLLGYPEPGKTTVYDDLQTIDIENVPLNGGLLIKTLVLSIDPYLRGRMRPTGDGYVSIAI